MRFIGCKKLLLENIKKIIDTKVPNANSFCDIFSGTSTVARYFKQWYEITSNDLLFFSYVLQKGTIENDCVPKFDRLQSIGIEDPIEYFKTITADEMEKLSIKKRFFQNTYAPNGGRMYITNENALRIDSARNKVEEWLKEEYVSENEYYYLVACIIEGIPFVSNISGTYGAYHKQWEKRSFKIYEPLHLEVTTNHKLNRCFNENGAELLTKISGDILYIDPPYNERQYLPNYHVLETAAKYDFPEVRGVTAQRPYDNQKSDFCIKSKVAIAFEQLISNAKYKHIILSYSTDGLMSLEEIEKIMKKYGKAETFEVNFIPYRRFKSRSKSNRSETLSELLIYIEKEI